MQKFVFDVELNWVDGLNRGYNIPEFYEWEKDDIEYFSKMPVVFISKELFDYIQEDYDELPDEILEYVYNKTFTKHGTRYVEVEYAFVMTDGNRVLAVDTEGDTTPSRKSKVSLEIMEKVEEAVALLQPLKVEFEIPEVNEDGMDSFALKLLSVGEENTKGLTRREKTLKDITFKCLFKLAMNDNVKETRYFYTGLFGLKFRSRKVTGLSSREMVDKMHEELKEGWNDRHYSFGKELANYFPLYRNYWKDVDEYEKHRKAVKK